MDKLEKLKAALIGGNIEAVASLTQQLLDEKESVQVILKEGLVAGFDEIGQMWEEGEVFIPEVLRSAKSMEKAMAILKPLFIKKKIKPMGTILLGTVAGDIHDIGKNMVKTMLEGGGFELVDLGVDVPIERFVTEAKKKKPEVVAMSTLLTTTMPGMESTIVAIKKAKIKAKILVGGAPVTKEFAEQIGATAYGADALAAVKICKSWLAS